MLCWDPLLHQRPGMVHLTDNDTHLHLTDVDGLRRAWYTGLIAWYDDGEQELHPIDVDLRTAAKR